MVQERVPQVRAAVDLAWPALFPVSAGVAPALRSAVEAHPEMKVIANCDDVLVTSAALDAKNVVWVSAGVGFTGDSTSCPRTGGAIVRTEKADGTPDW